MIKSMTGYGHAEIKAEGKGVQVEIKSLNSKQIDFVFRLPSAYNEKEIALRKLASETLRRGKVYIQLTVEKSEIESSVEINSELALRFIGELRSLEDQAAVNSRSDYLSIVMRMPEVVRSKAETIDEHEYQMVEKAMKQALEDIDRFRIQEGEILQADFEQRIAKILSLLEAVQPHEQERIGLVRQRIEKELNTLKDKVDPNRFEQELIFYLEKLDITEEKIRLEKHCRYFLDTLHNEDEEKGKKLGFVAQEIGREINTLGSKANHAAIQQLVVQMKDELEKIKEQMLNIL